MKSLHHIPYYIIAFALFILLKFIYASANNNDVFFLTKPLDSIISFVLDSNSVYFEDIGFYHKTLNITIDKSCSGFNFLLLAFLTSYFSSLKVLKSHFLKIIGIPIALFVSYFFTLLVNASRILTSILIENKTNLNYSWLHEAQGTFIYVSFLIILYLFINHAQRYILTRYEKLT